MKYQSLVLFGRGRNEGGMREKWGRKREEVYFSCWNALSRSVSYQSRKWASRLAELNRRSNCNSTNKMLLTHSWLSALNLLARFASSQVVPHWQNMIKSIVCWRYILDRKQHKQPRRQHQLLVPDRAGFDLIMASGKSNRSSVLSDDWSIGESRVGGQLAENRASQMAAVAGLN